MYKGQVINGLVWFVFVAGGYMAFVLPGSVLHLLRIIRARMGDPRKPA